MDLIVGKTSARTTRGVLARSARELTMVSLPEASESSEVLTAAEPAIGSPDNACATVAEPPEKRRRTRVGFDEVRIYEHDTALTNDRIPSTGGPSIGLGSLRVVTLHRMDSYDKQRDVERTGVRHIDASRRGGGWYLEVSLRWFALAKGFRRFAEFSYVGFVTCFLQPPL